MIKKEKFIEEVELAYKLFDLVKDLDYESRHRVHLIADQLIREKHKLDELQSYEKQNPGLTLASFKKD